MLLVWPVLIMILNMMYFDTVECMRSRLYWTLCLHGLINDYMANILMLLMYFMNEQFTSSQKKTFLFVFNVQQLSLDLHFKTLMTQVESRVQDLSSVCSS